MNRKARAVWQGTGKEGTGHLTSDSGVLSSTPYSFKTRFENEKGTNPEELIAAAHAGCFSMAFSGELGRAGHEAESVETNATVHVDKVGDGFAITRIELDTRARVPGIDDEEFQRLAEAAKEGCPVSQALGAVGSIEVKAALVQ